MKTCLIVIDVQESFRHRPYFRTDTLPAQNALIAGCVAAGVPVVRVLHSDGPEQADNPFALASRFATLCSMDEALARISL